MTRSAVAFAVAVFALSADGAPVPVRSLTLPARPAAEPLPPGAIARLGSNRFRVPGGIDRLAASLDGRFVAASGSGGLTVFDAATGRPVARIRDYLFLETIGFAADGTLLALGLREDGNTGIVRYDPATGRMRSQAVIADFANGGATGFSPDGDLLAAASGNEIRVYASDTGKVLGRIKFRKDAVNAVAFTPDSRRLGVSTQNNLFLVYDRLTAGEVCRVKVKDPIVAFALSHDGRRAAIAGGTNAVSLIDTAAGAVVRRVKLKDAAERVAFTAAGELITYCSATNSARMFDAGGKEVRRIRGLTDLMQFELSPDGKTLIGGTMSGAIRLWDAASGKRLRQSAELPEGINQLAFVSPDRLAGFAPGVGWLGWDVATGKQKRIGPRAKANELPFGLSPDARRVVVFGPKGMRVLDAATAKELHKFDSPDDANFERAWFSADAKTVFGWETGSLRVWDLGSGKARRVEFGGKYNPVALDVSPDGTRLAAALVDAPAEGGSAVIRALDLSTGKPLYEFTIPGHPSDVTYTPDGSRFVVLSRQAVTPTEFPPLQVQIHDAASGRVLRRLSGEYAEHAGLPFSPDGRVIAMLGMDYSVRLLELASGKDRAVFEHSQLEQVEALAFSPDGLLLASAGGDVPIYVWDVRTRRTPVEQRGTLPPDTAAPERLWHELGSDDAEAAYRALTTLEQHPAAAVRLFRGKLRPAAPADAAAVAAWIAALDSLAYRDRVAAHRELAKVADRATPALRAAVARAASPEVRERLNNLLDQVERPTADMLRVVRAVEVLEFAGMAEAKVLLREWSTGAAGARLTVEAAAALKRLR
jgi:WD40 repeat protein